MTDDTTTTRHPDELTVHDLQMVARAFGFGSAQELIDSICAPWPARRRRYAEPWQHGAAAS